MGRMQELYEKKGYPKEWKQRGVASSQEFAILTNEIMHGTFALKVDEYKQVKALARENLRDHMTDIELILTMLAEATTPPSCTATVIRLAWHRSRRMPKTAAQWRGARARTLKSKAASR